MPLLGRHRSCWFRIPPTSWFESVRQIIILNKALSCQVLEHEWVVSRGGILPRPLGQDVVYGAATVASVRRLRNLCGGAGGWRGCGGFSALSLAPAG